MMRKFNSAAFVMQIMSHRLFVIVRSGYVNIDNAQHGCSLRLDGLSLCGVIVITSIGHRVVGSNDASKNSQQTVKEGRSPPRRRHTEPNPRQGRRSQIQGGRVLRPLRRRAGQIRNVAARLDGARVRDKCSEYIWGFEADVLSGKGRLRRRGNRRACSQEARPARAQQTSRGSVGFSRKASFAGDTHSCAQVGNADSREVRSRCSSKNDRASAQWKKNSAIKPDATELGPIEPSMIAARYETLRMAALGTSSLPIESRGGLVLFLRRGMWGWARALAQPHAATVVRHPAPSSATSRPADKAIIHVFATMAMNSNTARAQ